MHNLSHKYVCIKPCVRTEFFVFRVHCAKVTLCFYFEGKYAWPTLSTKVRMRSGKSGTNRQREHRKDKDK